MSSFNAQNISTISQKAREDQLDDDIKKHMSIIEFECHKQADIGKNRAHIDVFLLDQRVTDRLKELGFNWIRLVCDCPAMDGCCCQTGYTITW